MPARPSRRFNLDRRIVLTDPGEAVKDGLTERYPNSRTLGRWAKRTVKDSDESIRDDTRANVLTRRYIVRWTPDMPGETWTLTEESASEVWEIKSVNEIDRKEWVEIVAERVI